jgi:ribosome-associated translation inhibitor RaiA
VTRHAPTLHIDLVTDGDVRAADAAYARRKVGTALVTSRRPVLAVRIRLRRLQNPALALPAVATATADVNGQVVRAQVAGATMREAIDALERRLRRASELLGDRIEERYREPRKEVPGYAPRPATDRSVVRYKTYDPEPLTAEEATAQMELLDYDFYLFADRDLGTDAIVYRTAEGTRHVTSAPESSDDDARSRLDASGEPFCFYRVAGHGRVMYRRFDGNYGIIQPGVPRVPPTKDE